MAIAGVGAAAAPATGGLSLIPAGVAAGADLLGGLFQQQGQQSSIAQQESFQQNMSNTAYQRSVADMEKAGLNPALMYGSGGPESTPSGASMTPPNLAQGAAGDAMSAMSTQKQMQVSDSQIAQNMAQAAKTTASIPVENFEGHLAGTMDALASGLETYLTKWGKSNASGNSIANVVNAPKSSVGNPLVPHQFDQLPSPFKLGSDFISGDADAVKQDVVGGNTGSSGSW